MTQAANQKQFRHPPKQAVNGIVLLNKPAGVSSNGILQKVRRLFNAKKAGHTGALDPFATGLLPICFGEATKVSGLLLDSDKGYRATLKLGEQSDTGDTEGEIIHTKQVPVLSDALINQTLAQFVGDIEQIPPMYSALKHQGKPLYWYARQGIEIERPARPIKIFSLRLISWSQPKNATTSEVIFDVLCSKGTYVRTLGEDIAKALGTLGHLTALHRIQSGSLTADQMLSYEQMEAALKVEDAQCPKTPENIQAKEQAKNALLLPVDLPLAHLQRIDLVTEQAKWLRNGGHLRLPKPDTDLVRFYNPEGICLGVGEWLHEHERIKPKRLFNLPELDRVNENSAESKTEDESKPNLKSNTQGESQ